MSLFKNPIVDVNNITEIEEGVWVIQDSNHTPLVPNIGIIIGEKATLVIDTGFGRDNALAIIDKARRLSGKRALYLTHTHCHPEHGFGANAVAEEVTIVYNESQWAELQEKGATLLQMFRQLFPQFASMLNGVEFVRPDFLYTGSLSLDLGGGYIVEFREVGGAHSRGDQVISIRKSKSVLFAGDLIEEGTFGILGDNDSHATPWIERLKKLGQLNPDIVVPGHGLIGGPELIANYLAYFEFAKRRVLELRSDGKLSEPEIVDKVGSELIRLHPDWGNQGFAKKTVADFSWPARP